MLQKNKSGIAAIAAVLITVFVISLLAVGLFMFDSNEENVSEKNNQIYEEVNWRFGYESKEWTVSGTPPECPDPLEFPAPIDVTKATGIIAPGQIRGGDYKPHGGYRFDDTTDNNIEVKAIMDGYITKASRYEDDWGTQSMVFYVNDCGIMVMHDHLLTLTPKLEKMFESIPVGKNADSRTTEINPRVYLEEGELIATSIGYEDFPEGAFGKNIFIDFGLYDLRKTNGVEYSREFRKNNPNINEYGTHAVCWIDSLEEPAKSISKKLPVTGNNNKSDYCE